MADTQKANHPFQEIDFTNRIQELARRMQARDIDGALILQNTDRYYFTGTIQQSYLYIPAEGEPVLMVRKDLDRAKSESPIRPIEPVNSPKDIPALIDKMGYKRPKRLGLEYDVLPTSLFFAYENLFPGVEMTDISHEIRTMRAVKSPKEINRIRSAAALADRVFEHVSHCLSEGMPEIEFAGKVEAFMRKLGHQGIVRMRMWGGEMFFGHLMAGKTAAIPSYPASPTGGEGMGPNVAQGPGLRIIEPHDPVLVDFVFTHEGYLADQTRIFTINGLPDDMIAAHEAMIDVQNRIKHNALPGTTAGRLYDLAREQVEAQGYSDYFMGADPKRVQFIGHGVGLELDEFPFLAKGQDMALKEGMIIALEPKLVFPGKGVVGIENTHVVTTHGLEHLNRFPDAVAITAI